MLMLVVLNPKIVKMLSDDCAVFISYRGEWPYAVGGACAKNQQEKHPKDVTVWPLRRPGKLARKVAWIFARLTRMEDKPNER